MSKRSLLIPVLLAVGCAKTPSSTPAPTTSPAPSSAPAPVAAALPQAPPPADMPPPSAGPLKGPILEKIDAAGYSYLRLGTPAGDAWAAVPQTPHAVGTVVEVVDSMRMDGFESKTLNRRFEKLVFGKLGGITPATTTAAPAPAPAAAPAPAPAAAAPAPAGNLRTVADIFAQRATLKDTTVTLRGKVVKSTAGVMNRTWLHIQDGSGSSVKMDNDITVTTQDSAAIGDEVVVQGKVSLDRDFGAGYKYGVIIEEATVKKQ
ncbi:MAG: nucleotide-binding protein [Myxococcota bacterium]